MSDAAHNDYRKSSFEKAFKCEMSNTINIKTELDSDNQCTYEQDEPKMEPTFSIVKTEYEFQSSYTNSTIKKEDEMSDEDANEYNKGDDDEQSVENDANDEDHGGYDDDEDNDFVSNKTETELKSKSRHIEQYHNFSEKRKILDAYMLRACPYCGLEFEFLTDWNTHLDEVHNHSSREKTQFTHIGNRRAKCNECGTTITYKIDAIISHVFFHLPIRNIYKCKICRIAKFRQFTMLQHIETRHFDVVGEALSVLRGENFTLCPYCDKYVGVLIMIAIHIQKEHSEIYEQKLWYVCPVCGEKFAEETAQKNHLKSQHQFHTMEGLCFQKIEGKKYRCLKCNALIPSGKFCQLPHHALSHHPHKCFKCRYCDYSHEKRWKVIKHSCEGLQLDIKNTPNLISKTSAAQIKEKRSKWDASNKLFVCPKCGKDFEEESPWEVHMIKEHNFNDIECLNFRTETTADGEGVIICNVCKRKFVQKNRIFNLRRHAITHMAYRIYKCKLCARALESMSICPCLDINGSSLSIHHVCPKCGKECKSHGNWKRHINRVHQLRRPSNLGFVKSTEKADSKEVTSYACSQCDEVITQPEPLCLELMFKHASNMHMLFKCYKCSKCGETSSNNDIMVEHARNCNVKLEIERCKRDEAKDEAECSRIAKCQCHVCGAMASSEDIIRTHLNDIHQLEIVSTHIFTWICTECELKFDTRRESFQHVLGVHLERTYNKSQIDLISFSCPVCNMKFAEKKEWNEHIFEQHELNTDKGRRMQDLGRRFKCMVCNKDFDKKISNKLNHSLEHLPISPFKCLSCCVEFKKINSAKKHVQHCVTTMKAKQSNKRKSSDEKINFAKKAKKESSQLKKPKVEPVMEPIVSNKEEPIFSLTSMAKSSPKSHVWNKYCNYMTYACPECNMPCESSESWHSHISMCHNFFAEEHLNMSKLEDKIRKCNECGIIISGGILHAQRHKLTHMPHQSFICKICSHRSRTNNVLIQHIERRHFKAGVFRCSICAAVQSSTLERDKHIKTEHPDAENVCEICMKIFSSKKSLRLHREKHNANRKRFECGFCERSYYQKSERKIHWIRWHPMEFAKMEIEPKKYEETYKKNILKSKKHKTKDMHHMQKKEAPESEDDLDSNALSDLAGSKPSTSSLKIQKGQTMKDEKSFFTANKEVVIKSEPESDGEAKLELITFKEEPIF